MQFGLLSLSRTLKKSSKIRLNLLLLTGIIIKTKFLFNLSRDALRYSSIKYVTPPERNDIFCQSLVTSFHLYSIVIFDFLIFLFHRGSKYIIGTVAWSASSSNIIGVYDLQSKSERYSFSGAQLTTTDDGSNIWKMHT